MKTSRGILVSGAILVALAAEVATPVHLGLIGEAGAIIGRPASPVSYAGVARRSAYRGAAVTTAAVATTAVVATSAAASSQAAAAAAAAPPPPAPAAPAVPAGAALAVGTIVTGLPSGCVSAPIGGIEYYLCDGTYSRPTFQGNNLVYVVQVP